jgi:putative acetyltransferase
MSSHSEILFYQPSLKSYFKKLNEEWLNTYYFVTEEDDKILSDPEKIIHEGGCIVFAKLNDEIVGTCALMKEKDHEFEIAKMAVTEKARGKKIGQLMMGVVIEEARKNGAKIISLDTASQLKPAIAIYKKFGFIQTSEERIHPLFKRKTFRMELSLV